MLQFSLLSIASLLLLTHSSKICSKIFSGSQSHIRSSVLLRIMFSSFSEATHCICNLPEQHLQFTKSLLLHLPFHIPALNGIGISYILGFNTVNGVSFVSIMETGSPTALTYLQICSCSYCNLTWRTQHIHSYLKSHFFCKSLTVTETESRSPALPCDSLSI